MAVSREHLPPGDLAAHLEALPADSSWALDDDIFLLRCSLLDAFQRACLHLDRTPREARARLNLLTGNNPPARHAALSLLQKRAAAADIAASDAPLLGGAAC